MAAKNEAFFKQMGARIAQARKERGLTQEQLAEQLGVSQQALAHYEVGRIGVASAMLPRFAELLDVSFDELLVGQPSIRIPGKRGPASRLEQQIARVSQLPKASQKAVMQVLDAMIAQHAA
ncbi:helix-turn-helix domain-containing protein [Sphingomonas bacterium]|uniref:helix-turn-helix domain-containing protein n=1 Tax=Sphingomonas bacterium TaxID=1895847 RepID=UPI001576F97D|nr:helix-turn-helix transcriptional regulator [Sphingomonas bacterium]